MALSQLARGAIAVGSALGAGLVLSYVVGGRRRVAAPAGLDSPIDKDGCSLKFFPSPNRGDGNGLNTKLKSPPDWIVIHDTEDDRPMTAMTIARYFFNDAANVSSQLVVDETGACYRCVADDQISWAAGAANPRSLQIEMVAPSGAAAKWTPEQWLSRGRLFDATVDRVANWVEKFGIPARFVDAAGLKRGERGITTHYEAARAFGGSHFDPGKGFPMDEFISRVRAKTSLISFALGAAIGAGIALTYVSGEPVATPASWCRLREPIDPRKLLVSS